MKMPWSRSHAERQEESWWEIEESDRQIAARPPVTLVPRPTLVEECADLAARWDLEKGVRR